MPAISGRAAARPNAHCYGCLWGGRTRSLDCVPGALRLYKALASAAPGAVVTVAGKRAYIVNGSQVSLQLELPVDAPLGDDVDGGDFGAIQHFAGAVCAGGGDGTGWPTT